MMMGMSASAAQQQRDDSAEPLLSVLLSDNQQCFVYCTPKRFGVCELEPFKVHWERADNMGGFGAVQMFGRSQLMALLAAPKPFDARMPRNVLYLWDDAKRRAVGEVRRKETILAVRIRADRVVVVTRHHAVVYEFADLKVVDDIPTWDNPLGLVETSTATRHLLLVTLGSQCGAIRCHDFSTDKYARETTIQAHETAVQALALTGNRLKAAEMLVATASQRGTVIRIFSVATGEPLHELRRGTEPVTIHSLAFHPSLDLFACTSNNGTLHIFSLTASAEGKAGSTEEATATAGSPIETKRAARRNQSSSDSEDDGAGDPGRLLSSSSAEEHGQHHNSPFSSDHQSVWSVCKQIASNVISGLITRGQTRSFARWTIPDTGKSVVVFSRFKNDRVNILTVPAGVLYVVRFPTAQSPVQNNSRNNANTSNSNCEQVSYQRFHAVPSSSEVL